MNNKNFIDIINLNLMESEKVEEKPPTEQTQPPTSSEVPPSSEPKKESTELTQEKKDSCKILLFNI